MLITNFDDEKLEKYRKAITKFKNKTGNGRLYINGMAYDIDNRLIGNSSALHSSENGDLSIFWRIYDKIK